MTQRPKLEVIWIGKENRLGLALRLLPEHPEPSCHARVRLIARGKAILEKRA